MIHTFSFMVVKLIKLKIFKNFFRSESTSGFILIACVIASLLIANSWMDSGFESLLNQEIGYHANHVRLKYPISLWINDGLMAIFFLLVGLEIKRELINGELSSIQQAMLPICGAIGGMAIPALVYILVNSNTATIQGWAIPVATDIAFALGVLAILGNKVPATLKVFLAALTIVDDLGAILIIAFFYTNDLYMDYLLCAGIVFSFQIAINFLGIRSLWVYLISGAVLWYLIHHSGVHATIAGALTAFTIPTKNNVQSVSPLERLEHLLIKPVNYIIMPLFALANTHIHFERTMINNLATPLSIGIILGLALGKPIGITSFSWLSVQLKISKMPRYISWNTMLSVSVLGGIGFTMSIFIALLSFADTLNQVTAKFAILIASVLSGCIGYFLLSRSKSSYTHKC